jgi:hypothetical protein
MTCALALVAWSAVWCRQVVRPCVVLVVACTSSSRCPRRGWRRGLPAPGRALQARSERCRPRRARHSGLWRPFSTRLPPTRRAWRHVRSAPHRAASPPALVCCAGRSRCWTPSTTLLLVPLVDRAAHKKERDDRDPCRLSTRPAYRAPPIGKRVYTEDSAVKSPSFAAPPRPGAPGRRRRARRPDRPAQEPFLKQRVMRSGYSGSVISTAPKPASGPSTKKISIVMSGSTWAWLRNARTLRPVSPSIVARYRWAMTR